MKGICFFVLMTICYFSYMAPVTFAADGWAGENGGTTGGAGSTVINVSTASAFKSAVESTSAYIVQVSGTIDLVSVGGRVDIRSNKTIRGIDNNVTIIGNLKFRDNATNIIIERLIITNPNDGDSYDGISVRDGITNLIITKCTVYDCGDGCIDITSASDYITMSWCKFYYTESAPDPDHRFVNLIGSSDGATGDMGKLNVTMHHNWWASGCDARMPRVRYGQVHVYNNYYDCQGNNYCIGVGNESHIRVESNYFNRAYDPWKDYYGGSGTPGEIGWNSDNIFYRCYLPIWAPNRYSTIFTPPYAYTLDDTEDIPAIVGSYAGAENPYPPHWLYTVYGDFDKDGVVESDDFETFIGYWMETFGIDEADYFDDDIIDAHEFALFAQNWLEP